MKKYISILIAIVIVLSPLLSTGVSLLAADSRIEGEGTKGSPYLIRTVEQFNLLDANNGLEDIRYSYFKLMNDLDFENVSRDPMDLCIAQLDGNNHVLRNLKIEGTICVGLFSTIGSGTIKDLGIEGAVITGTGNYVGAFFGVGGDQHWYGGSAILSNCYVKDAVITGQSAVGGLGGLFHYKSKATDCYVTNSEVTSSGTAGGFVGAVEDSVEFVRCYSEAKVEGEDYVSGFVGLANETCSKIVIDQCYSKSQIKGKNYVSGLLGQSYNESNDLHIKDCYFSGSIQAEKIANGLLAYYYDNNPQSSPFRVRITNSYATGTIEGSQKFGIIDSERFHWTTDLKLTSNYFDFADITEPEEQARDKEEMLRKSNYRNWDFETIWTMEEGKSYPKLRYEPEESPEEPKTLKIILEVDEILQLSTLDELIENRELVWTSSDSNTASVDSDGKVTAKAEGNAVITVSNSDNTYTEKIYVLIMKNAKEYRLSVDLAVGKRCRLTIDDGLNITACTWVSSDPSIAEVDDKGVVTAKSKGLALILVKDKADEILGQLYIRVRP